MPVNGQVDSIRVDQGDLTFKASQTALGFWVLQIYDSPEKSAPPAKYGYWEGNDPIDALGAVVDLWYDARNVLRPEDV